ncbi:MAG: peptidase C11 [Lachnospiraceae bacterium]|nr:peptidase C11 [Lachnospiraceae bacterium]
MAQRPTGRKTNVTSGGSGVHRRGSGLGSGPVGSGHMGGSGSSGSGGQGPRRSKGGFSPLMLIIALAVALFGGGGGLMSGLLGGSGGSSYDPGSSYQSSQSTQGSQSSQSGALSTALSSGSLPSYYSQFLGGSTTGSGSGWSETANTGSLDQTVASAARKKFTTIKGNGADVVTLMVYMCGTDLESNYSMASKDLQEMTKASLSSNVNIIVYTGGCKRWANSVVSNSTNQIYKIENGGLKCLVRDDGAKAMTDPATLTAFIHYCTQNYPANRQMLIFWDHGGGSISGYGYDEKFPRSGSMSLSGINGALKSAGTTFDFIGFDACLMATAENALMLSEYGDYMIASEETEPGIGWYYTNWLTKLSANTAMSTLEIGKQITDDFVSTCAAQCQGQKTTLSVIDLAEFGETFSKSFASFSKSTTELIKGNEYQTVSTARNGAREFATSNKIDQIDLIDFANRVGTEEAKALSATLLDAVKYNRTSSNMTNAYGVSIYFPYRSSSKVSQAISTYSAIGLDSEYSDCIREFAGLEVSGQLASGGTSSPLSSLLGEGSSYSSEISAEDISNLLGLFLGGGGGRSIAGLDDSNNSFFSERSLSDAETADYIAANSFDSSYLAWQSSSEGYVVSLPEEQWRLVEGLDLAVYVDDGEGYIDMGLDNVFSFDDDGNLIGSWDGTWLSINSQPVAYYHMTTIDGDDGTTISGYVPACLNGQRVRLIVIFDPENEYGYIAGAEPDYNELTETETISRGLIELKDGDVLDFICDFYSYDGEYQDSYYLGDPMTVDGELMVSNTDVGADGVALYRFTDIYQQHYWTEAIPG